MLPRAGETPDNGEIWARNKATKVPGRQAFKYAVLCWGSHQSVCGEFGKDKVGALALLPCGCFGFMLATVMFQSPDRVPRKLEQPQVRSSYVCDTARRLFINEPAADPLQIANTAPRQRKPLLRYHLPTRDTESSIDPHKSNASRPRIFATNNSRPGRHAASQTSHATLSWFHGHTASSGRWPLAGDQGSSREAVCTYDDTCEVRHGAMDELR
ncbi:hypothetical protein BJX68DRAFT_174766 [Aspergillus pseudodeflectus]|uniref:Uncharacterized protein n=1 Tax=Aspergillus pseudodeflectus TaxID=176178 RepID=A0ABR4JME1_9EURO